MRTKLFYLFFGLSFLPMLLTAQNDWKPQTHFTGYINSVAEYSGHQDTSAIGLANPRHAGIGLAQVGFLASYKPLEKLEIKSTLVYSPWVRSWHDVVVESYGLYSFNNQLKVGAGKFLTPLSPSNLYFYAPLNPSGVLPNVVSHHMFFPQSISGFQVAGELGEDLKAKYNATYGNYYITDHLEGGVLGIQGQEEIVPFSGHYEVYSTSRPESYLGGSGRLSLEYTELMKLGLNLFDGTESNLVVLDPATGGPASFEQAKQISYGVDFHLNVKDIQLNAEYWYANIHTTKSVPEYKLNYTGYYGELIYNGTILKPWARYEYIEDAKAIFADGSLVDLPAVTYSAGLAYRPIYETIFKLEYRKILVKDYEKTDAPASSFKDYGYMCFSFVFSF